MAVKQLSASTIKIYENSLKKLRDVNIINTQETIKFLNENVKNIESRRRHYCAIIYRLRSENITNIIHIYSEEIKNLRNQIEKVNDKNEIKENETFISWKKILEIRDEYLAKNKIDKASLMISFYTLFPVRRNEDLHYMKYLSGKYKLKELDKNFNYYDSKNFIFNKYKTSFSYGQQIFKVPLKLKRIFNDYITTFEIKNDELLLNYKFENDISKILKKKFDFTVNTFRHSFITYISKDNKLTLKRRKEISYKMSQNIDSQLIYNRILPDDDD